MSWFNGRSDGKYASMRIQPPMARSENLIVEDLDDEVLVYDQLNARAHCLSGAAASVWRVCDGETTVTELAVRLDLESNGLLEGPAMFKGSTRREFSRKAAQIGGGVVATSAIYSIVAPTAMAAITPSVAQCQFYSADSCDGCTNICGCCCCCQGCS